MACLLACAAQAQAALQLRTSDESLTRGERIATRHLLDGVTQRLPSTWTNALGTIDVEWRDDLPTHVYGRAMGRRLLLDRNLLAGWMATQSGANREEPATRAALAAVVHELAHFYDRTPHGRLSSNARLLDLAGWQVSPMRLGLRKHRNDFVDRSPDRYELSDPVEFVAVNLEYFLLDPEYGCRRPALHRFFSRHFGVTPPAAECAPGLVYVEADTDAAQMALLNLDPGRVFAVDYLLAEGNERPMSRWGHSMLRLVICAPGRKRGPDCRLDLTYHRVLSFRAFVDDVQISSWRGLTGSYPSRLYVLPLAQVIEEYTRIELRGLQSIPLQLDETEIAAVLERAAQLHWSYDGRYYFLGNNCAVETFKLLHDGVARLAGSQLASITPTGLLHRLEQAGIADGSVLDDGDSARRLGYYFEPLSARYQAMFDVARRSLGMPQSRVQDWLALPPGQRAAWLQRADLRASAALLLLEHAALRQQELLARDELKRHVLGRRSGGGSHVGVRNASPGGENDRRAALQEALGLDAYLGHPASLLPESGYGLPQAPERAAMALESERRSAQRRERNDSLRRQARQWLSLQRRAALEATEGNVQAVGARLRWLHEQQGGLQLL